VKPPAEITTFIELVVFTVVVPNESELTLDVNTNGTAAAIPSNETFITLPLLALNITVAVLRPQLVGVKVISII
jgi:hypothetical protein